MRVFIGIEGIQELQAANNRAIASLRPNGAVGRAVQYAVVEAHRYATVVTHADTGALQASHRMEITDVTDALRGRVFIDPASVNPRGERPAIYGRAEHERGGSHAFYDRVIDERGAQISDRALAIIADGIKW